MVGLPLPHAPISLVEKGTLGRGKEGRVDEGCLSRRSAALYRSCLPLPPRHLHCCCCFPLSPAPSVRVGQGSGRVTEDVGVGAAGGKPWPDAEEALGLRWSGPRGSAPLRGRQECLSPALCPQHA